MKIIPGEVICITQDMLDSIPSSVYSEHTWELINKSESNKVTTMDVEKENADHDSDSKVLYWSNDNDNIPARQLKCRKARTK